MMKFLKATYIKLLLMHQKRNTDKVYLLYPTYRFEDIETKTPIMKSKVKDKDGLEKEINVHVVRLPFVFEEDIDKVKSN